MKSRNFIYEFLAGFMLVFLVPGLIINVGAKIIEMLVAINPITMMNYVNPALMVITGLLGLMLAFVVRSKGLRVSFIAGSLFYIGGGIAFYGQVPQIALTFLMIQVAAMFVFSLLALVYGFITLKSQLGKGLIVGALANLFIAEEAGYGLFGLGFMSFLIVALVAGSYLAHVLYNCSKK